MAWTDEKKAEVIEKYEDTMKNEYHTDEERAAATIEVVKELADEFGETTNGVRAILNKAGVYIKKGAAKPAASATGDKPKRVNKAEALATLKEQITMINSDLVNDEIIDKMTGKSAQYFSSIFHELIPAGE